MIIFFFLSSSFRFLCIVIRVLFFFFLSFIPSQTSLPPLSNSIMFQTFLLSLIDSSDVLISIHYFLKDFTPALTLLHFTCSWKLLFESVIIFNWVGNTVELSFLYFFSFFHESLLEIFPLLMHKKADLRYWLLDYYLKKVVI